MLLIFNDKDRFSSFILHAVQFHATCPIVTNNFKQFLNFSIPIIFYFIINYFNNCINSCPYLEGYVFEENDNICGYAMVAKSFSTEFGKPCIWIEDLYIKEEYRHKKLGSLFFDFLKDNYKDTIQRLEVDKNNVFAIKAYKKNNFEEVDYLQFIRKN